MEVPVNISPPIELHAGVCFKMRDPLQAGMPKKGKMLALAGSRRGGKLEICRNLIVLGKKTDKMLGTEYIGQHFMYLKRTWTWGVGVASSHFEHGAKYNQVR